MEHLGQELDCGWFVRIGFVESEDELESAIFERSICGAEDDSVPDHKVVSAWSTGDTPRRVGGESLKVSNEALL